MFVDGGVPKSTREDLEAKYPSLFVLLCAAHSLDLLLEDFYKKNQWAKNAVDALREVVKFIRNHHRPLALFRNKSHLELLKPGDTRFGSNFVMLERLLQVHDILDELMGSREWKAWVKRQKKRAKKEQAAEIKATIRNVVVWKDAKALVKASKPFVIAMKLAGGDVPSMGKIYKRMSDAIDKLKKLENSDLSQDRRDAMVQQAEDRWVYMDHDLHRVGYALDPEHQLHDWNSDPDITDSLERVFDRYYGDDIDSIAAADRQLEEYRTRQGRFGRSACVTNMKMMSGWRWRAKYGGNTPELQRMAMDVLSLVSGACSCERSWSAFDFIHTKKRNKLSASKCEELVYVFSNLRLLRKAVAANAFEMFYQWVDAEATEDPPNPTNATVELMSVCDTSSDEASDPGSELDDDEISDSD